MAVKLTHFSPPCYILIAVFLFLLVPSPSSCRIPPCHGHCLSSTFFGGWVARPTQLPKRVLTQGEPGISIGDLGHHAGYIKLPHGTDSRLFYFFFESRTNKSDPVLLWLTGWRSCESALFYENGPFRMSDDNNSTLTLSHFGWDKATNLIYVDQPANIGFSYTTDDSDAPRMEQNVIDDLYNFIQGFFEEHPEYAKNEFYIAGESHAGHFNPLLAERIRQGNEDLDGIHINLKGFALGNALTSPEYQFAAYPDYALEKGLINDSDRQSITKNLLPRCLNQTKICNTAKVTEKSSRCYTAYHACDWFFSSFLKYIESPLNYYDIRTKDTYNFSRMETFLNERTVQEALGVPDRVFFQDLNPGVYRPLRVEWMERRDTGIPAMLEDGIKVLVYAGEFDLMYNWLGNWRWVHALEWAGKEAFNASPNVSFVVDGSNAGLLKSHGPLAFLKVYNAGRMVAMDQPNVGLEMVRKWVHGNLA